MKRHSTSLRRRRNPRDALRRYTRMVLYTKLDAQCNELATVIDKTELTKLNVARSMCCGKFFSKSRVWDKVLEGFTVISGAMQLSLKHSG